MTGRRGTGRARRSLAAAAVAAATLAFGAGPAQATQWTTTYSDGQTSYVHILALVDEAADTATQTLVDAQCAFWSMPSIDRDNASLAVAGKVTAGPAVEDRAAERPLSGVVIGTVIACTVGSAAGSHAVTGAFAGPSAAAADTVRASRDGLEVCAAAHFLYADGHVSTIGPECVAAPS